jgi:hypothetical protein
MGQPKRSPTMRLIPLPALALCLSSLATAAAANDGFGGLAATGLTFSRTDAVAMEEEDLFISMDKVRVAYVFRNLTGKDVTGEVIFPLPPVSVGSLMETSWNLPEDLSRPDLVNFTARVDGQPVAVQIDRIAVIEPPWEEDRPESEQYDTPGRDVTALLQKYGLPLTLDYQAVGAILETLPPEARAELKAESLADFYEGDTAQGLLPEAWPLWSVIWRYHWTQTFPAGAVMRIEHEYDNRPPGGLFTWEDPPDADYHREIADRYCVDAGTSRAIARAISYTDQGETYLMGVSHDISYVLRTANSWAGPIGKFRLTVDKGAAANVISLCADGVKKTGPTTFTVEKTGFAPKDDLHVLIVSPIAMDQ